MSLLNGAVQVMTSDKLRVGTPDPDRYHSPQAVVLEHTGQPMSAIFGGANGTVIPRSTMYGASRGWKAKNDGPVNIYTLGPDEVMRGVSVNVQTLREAGVSKAASEAMQQASSMDSLGALALDVVAAATRYAGTPLEEPAPAAVAVPGRPSAAVYSQQELAAAVARQTRPVARPTQQPTYQQVEQPAAPLTEPPPLSSVLAGQQVSTPSMPTAHATIRPPEVRLTVDIPNGGRIQARYHQVIQAGRALVLVNDTRYPALMTYEPPDLRDEQDNPKPYPVLVQGAPGLADTVYLVYFTGVVFQLDHYNICSLLIEQSTPYDAQRGS